MNYCDAQAAAVSWEVWYKLWETSILDYAPGCLQPTSAAGMDCWGPCDVCGSVGILAAHRHYLNGSTFCVPDICRTRLQCSPTLVWSACATASALWQRPLYVVYVTSQRSM